MNYQVLYKKVGERIEYLRKEKRLTQEELAEKAGVHRAYFWDIENGRNISIKTAYNIARALGVKLTTLFDFKAIGNEIFGGIFSCPLPIFNHIEPKRSFMCSFVLRKELFKPFFLTISSLYIRTTLFK